MSEPCKIELRLAWYRNLETGLVRSFLGGAPKRGKWEITQLRHATPIGRKAMAERRPSLTEGDKP